MRQVSTVSHAGVPRRAGPARRAGAVGSSSRRSGTLQGSSSLAFRLSHGVRRLKSETPSRVVGWIINSLAVLTFRLPAGAWDFDDKSRSPGFLCQPVTQPSPKCEGEVTSTLATLRPLALAPARWNHAGHSITKSSSTCILESQYGAAVGARRHVSAAA